MNRFSIVIVISLTLGVLLGQTAIIWGFDAQTTVLEKALVQCMKGRGLSTKPAQCPLKKPFDKSKKFNPSIEWKTDINYINYIRSVA